MKAILKRIYYKLAAPMWHKLSAQLESQALADISARQKLASETQELRAEVRRLESILQVQSAYIDELKRTGLHEMVAQYAISKLRPPEVVARAIVQVLGGVEPVDAAKIHDVTADEIISLSRLFTTQADFETTRSAQSIEVAAAPRDLSVNRGDIDLLEAQLCFNTKNYLEREQASCYEIARLKSELALERLHHGRVTAGQ